MIQELDTLYKRGRGKILEWKIKVETVDRKVNIFVAYGELDGAKTITYDNNIKGKNIGKANETNPYEQAHLEAKSKINNKLKEGYKSYKELCESNEELLYSGISLYNFLDKLLPEYNTDVNGNEIPMNCQQYYRKKENWVDPKGKVWSDRKYYYFENPYIDKEKNALIIEFPCYIQPKVNGVRAFIKVVNGKAIIFSKKGLTYTLPHISEWVEQYLEPYELEDNEIILDGELYIHGEPLANIVSAVRAMQLNTQRVKFIWFDLAIQNVTQEERFKKLYDPKIKEIVQADLNSPVELVKTLKIGGDKRVQELTDLFIKEGYEGSICRSLTGLYEFGKRPKTIVKLKRNIEEEFMIIAVVPQEVDPTMGLFVCKTSQGLEFKVTPKGTEMFKRKVLIDASSFIGKLLTCKFYEYTPTGLPFHIIDNIIRDYE